MNLDADDITVCIPTIPERRTKLRRAIGTVFNQTTPARALAIETDLYADGAPIIRDRALRTVKTPWVAFLDDDDQFLPVHLETLIRAAMWYEADYVYSWYHIVQGDGITIWPGDVLPHFGKKFDPDHPTQTTITTLVRTELAQEVGFRAPPDGATIDGERYGEDFQFTIECIKAGGKIVHVPRRTWLWHHHGANTSGRPVG